MSLDSLLRLRATQNALQLSFLFILFFLLLVGAFGRTAKSLLEKILKLVTEGTCDQDLTDYLNTQKTISINIFLEVAIRDTCGT